MSVTSFRYEFRKHEDTWQRRLIGTRQWLTLHVENHARPEPVSANRRRGRELSRPTPRNVWTWL